MFARCSMVPFRFRPSTRTMPVFAAASGAHAVGVLHVATGERLLPPTPPGLAVTDSYIVKVPRSVAPLKVIAMSTAPPRATARVRASRKSCMIWPASS